MAYHHRRRQRVKKKQSKKQRNNEKKTKKNNNSVRFLKFYSHLLGDVKENGFRINLLDNVFTRKDSSHTGIVYKDEVIRRFESRHSFKTTQNTHLNLPIRRCRSQRSLLTFTCRARPSPPLLAIIQPKDQLKPSCFDDMLPTTCTLAASIKVYLWVHSHSIQSMSIPLSIDYAASML